MMRARSHFPNAPRRWLAAGLAAVVMMLGLMSVSPTLHGWAHNQAGETAGEHGHTPQPLAADHDCAVVEFAHGLTVAVAAVLPLAVPARWHEVNFPVATEPRLAMARYTLPPGRGPPQV
jgi:hypothetical protein